MPNLTIKELLEALKAFDEVTLMETLNINSEMIVERFIDLIEDDIERLSDLVELHEEDDETDY